MTTDEIKDLVGGGKEGKLAAIILLCHKLGGWVILALVAIGGLYIVETQRVAMTDKYIQEIQASRAEDRKVYPIIAANSDALNRVAYELKRLNDNKN